MSPMIKKLGKNNQSHLWKWHLYLPRLKPLAHLSGERSCWKILKAVKTQAWNIQSRSPVGEIYEFPYAKSLGVRYLPQKNVVGLAEPLLLGSIYLPRKSKHPGIFHLFVFFSCWQADRLLSRLPNSSVSSSQYAWSSGWRFLADATIHHKKVPNMHL